MSVSPLIVSHLAWHIVCQLHDIWQTTREGSKRDGEHCLQEQVYLALAIYVPEIRFCDLPTEGTTHMIICMVYGI